MDDLKNTIVNITKAITKTSGDLIKTTKLSMSIANEESALRNIYIDIGKKVHEIYAYGGSLGEFFDGKYKELDATEARIKELKGQLDIAKGAKTCPACGKSAPRSAEFCPKCGKPMSVEPATATDDSIDDSGAPNVNEPAAAAVSAERICDVCNHINLHTERFCESCGRML